MKHDYRAVEGGWDDEAHPSFYVAYSCAICNHDVVVRAKTQDEIKAPDAYNRCKKNIVKDATQTWKCSYCNEETTVTGTSSPEKSGCTKNLVDTGLTIYYLI